MEVTSAKHACEQDSHATSSTRALTGPSSRPRVVNSLTRLLWDTGSLPAATPSPSPSRHGGALTGDGGPEVAASLSRQVCKRGSSDGTPAVELLLRLAVLEQPPARIARVPARAVSSPMEAQACPLDVLPIAKGSRPCAGMSLSNRHHAEHELDEPLLRAASLQHSHRTSTGVPTMPTALSRSHRPSICTPGIRS
jgi:hypothetical protein